MSIKICPHCGGAIEESCLHLTPKKIAIILLVGIALGGLALLIQSTHQGKKPTQEMAQGSAELAQLRAAAKADPKNPEALLAFATELGIEIDSNPAVADTTLIFELIDVLKSMLELDPKDSRALLMMADLSFNQTAFSKAEEYYTRFLELKPEDNGTRAKLGSTLIFLGQHDRAAKELESVLKSEPKHFHALAYLAITHAQRGNKKQAESFGKQALENAPSPEAKERLSKFLASLNEDPEPQMSKEASPGVKQISSYLQAHPIAGSKFKGSELKPGGSLVLYFQDFPMEAMPPVAKEKFFSGLKAKLPSDSEITELVFVDSKTQLELDRLKVR